MMETRMGILLGVTLPLIILAYIAYYFFGPGAESDFFKNFSPEDVLRKTLPTEINYPEFNIAAVGKEFRIDGTRGKTCPIFIQVNQNGGNQFNRDEVLKSLEIEIEKEIKANGASLISQDISVSNRINIVYESGKVRGRIRVFCERENDFILKITADLEERSKRWRFANEGEGMP